MKKIVHVQLAWRIILSGHDTPHLCTFMHANLPLTFTLYTIQFSVKLSLQYGLRFTMMYYAIKIFKHCWCHRRTHYEISGLDLKDFYFYTFNLRTQSLSLWQKLFLSPQVKDRIFCSTPRLCSANYKILLHRGSRLIT